MSSFIEWGADRSVVLDRTKNKLHVIHENRLEKEVDVASDFKLENTYSLDGTLYLATLNQVFELTANGLLSFRPEGFSMM